MGPKAGGFAQAGAAKPCWVPARAGNLVSREMTSPAARAERIAWSALTSRSSMSDDEFV
jgi:hypothetical protein